MSHHWPASTHPYGPGMEHVSHSQPTRGVRTYSDGLGIWSAVATWGAKVAAGYAQDRWGGGGKMADDVYYPAAMAGVVHCPGPYDVGAVAQALTNLPDTGEGARIRGDIRALFGGNAWWSRMGVPLTPTEQAGALVAWAHGGHDCKPGGSGLIAEDIVQRVLAVEAARQTVPGRVQAAAERLGMGSEIVPGLSTPLLLGAAAVAVLALRR